MTKHGLTLSKTLSNSWHYILLALTKKKNKYYDSILVIIDKLTKMVYYKLVKVTINTFELAEVIIYMALRQHKLPDAIIIDWGLLFISKFWLLLYYFLEIKKDFQLLFIYTLMIKQKDKIIL